MLLRMITEIKVSSDWFGCVLVISFTSRRCSRNRSPGRLPVSSLIAMSASCAVNDIGRGTRKVISDLNESLRSRYFLYVMNERTSFASWASAFESSRLVIDFKWTSEQKVAYVFEAFTRNNWGLQKDSTSLWIVLE